MGLTTAAPPNDNDTLMHPMLNIGIRAARAAGNVITRNMDRIDTLQVDQKARNDFVSDVDRNAEAEIINVLKKAYPDHAILGEESGLIGNNDAEYKWIVDPLDGTTNFLHGSPYFSVSIALMHKNRIDQGVVYNPVSQELFTASRGDGAWLDGKRLRVSKTNHLDKALLGTGFPYRTGQDLDFYQRTLRHYTEKSGGIRRAGSAALDLASVAAGRLDGVWLVGLNAWDIAAGALIVREAGGLLNDFNGGDTWLDSGEVLAATPKVHHEMLQVMKPLVMSRDKIAAK